MIRPTPPTPSTVTPSTTPSTGPQAAAHQRLRAHLAYLKLPTAAEQLPAVLEAARAEDLSLTVVLERPPQTRGQCHRPPPRRQAAVCEPARALDAGGPDYDASPALDRALSTDLASLRFIEQASNVLLVGPPASARTTSPSAWHAQAVEDGPVGLDSAPVGTSPYRVVLARDWLGRATTSGKQSAAPARSWGCEPAQFSPRRRLRARRAR